MSLFHIDSNRTFESSFPSNTIINNNNNTNNSNNSNTIQHENTNKIFQITKIKNRKIWTNTEDERLLEYCANVNENQFHWKDIAFHFHNKTPLQCFSRYNRIKPGLLRGKWSKKDDIDIINLVNKYGKNWSLIAKIFTKRNGKQIRDRYMNVLDPQINKSKFTQYEDNLLIELYKQYGNKWSLLKEYFPGRTTDMIKNRFHSCLKKIFFYDKNIPKHKTILIESNKRNRDYSEETEDDISLNGKCICNNISTNDNNININTNIIVINRNNISKDNNDIHSSNETNPDTNDHNNNNNNHLEILNEMFLEYDGSFLTDIHNNNTNNNNNNYM